MKTLAIFLPIILAGSVAAAGTSCTQAEDAFFAQYSNQEFAKDSEAFRVNPDRWGEVAERYMNGALMMMMAEADNKRPQSKTAREFLVNAAVLDCWQGSVEQGNARTKEIAQYLNRQLPEDRRRQLETIAGRAQ